MQDKFSHKTYHKQDVNFAVMDCCIVDVASAAKVNWMKTNILYIIIIIL
jgi:hypothetical protein